MNIPLREYINYELMPALYERLDQVELLSEFKFRRNGNKYESTTRWRYTGREGKKEGGVYVYANNPSLLIDHSEKSNRDIIDYVRYDRTGSDIGFMEALNALAKEAQIKPFRGDLSQEELDRYRKAARIADAWETAINYCTANISDPQYKTEAKPVIDYLTRKRKYNIQDIVQMQLGYLPSQQGLFEHLKAAGFTDTEIKENIQLNAWIGNTHRLTIPIRNKSGKAIGMAVRNAGHAGEDLPKYFFNTGLSKTENLFNLYTKAKNGRVVLVEGQLDAAITQARGYEGGTVAAIGGKEISNQQLSHLFTAGAKEVFICLDNEETTKPEIKKTINKLREGEQIGDSIYIVQLPEGIKDVDQLVTEKGIEAFTECVNKATVYYKYLFNEVRDQFIADQEAGKSSDLLKSGFIEDTQRIATMVHSPIHRGSVIQAGLDMLNFIGLETTSDEFQAVIREWQYKEDEEKQRKSLKDIVKKVTEAEQAGKPINELLAIHDKVREIKTRSKRAEFEELDAIDRSEATVMERIRQRPEAVKIGYSVMIEKEKYPLTYPAGQLTFIAAPTGHGKTTVLINTALNIIKEYPNKEILFFTFEVSAEEITVLALNTFMNIHLNNANNNRQTLIEYYRNGGHNQYISNTANQLFEERKEIFYKEVYPRFKIINVEYSADELIEYIEHTRRRTSDAVIMIDYIQKLRSDKKGKMDSRFNELKFICEDMNAAAMRTGLPFVLAAQFNRDVLAPIDMAPTKMAEASDIEKIASEIIGVWNCTKRMSRKIDPKDAAEIATRYKITVGEKWFPENAIILEVLKSRSMGTGHLATLSYDGNKGVITPNNDKDKNSSNNQLEEVWDSAIDNDDQPF